eukprot:gene1198-10712_t
MLKNFRNHFSKSPQYQKNYTHKIVFLEGEPISNKTTTILEKLNKMGFTTYDNKLPNDVDSIEKFTQKIKTQLNFEKNKELQNKENFVFFNGSSLGLLLTDSKFHNLEKQIVSQTNELKKEFNIINLHCLTEDYMMKMRLAYHYEMVLHKEFNVEMVDKLHGLNEKYSHLFNDQLFTTDAKQAVYLLMQKFQIPFFELPKRKEKS